MRTRSRSAIVSAALELFAKKGFSATTTDEIARKAKVSKGLIFSYFPSKEDLLINILDDSIERWFSHFKEVERGRTPQEKFNLLIDGWLDLILKEPLIVRLGLQLNLDDTFRSVVKKKGDEYINRFFSSVRDLLTKLGSKNPDLDCYLLMFFFDGVTANYTVAPELFPIGSIKNHFVETLLSRWKKERKHNLQNLHRVNRRK
jgi:AcrR family transcriptional regulator